ncbi:MAG: substrate-binding periplasmic protein [Bacteriovoracaceae bacterium]
MKLFLLCSFIFPSLVFGASSFQELNWYSEVYPPYNFLDKDGTPDGIAVELLSATLVHLGSKKTKKDIKIVPWARGYRKAQKKGKLNSIFSTTRTKDRENLFKWIGPISKTTISIIGYDTFEELKKEDLIKYKYAVIRDDIGENLLKKLGIPEKNLIRVASIEQMLKLIRDKKGKKKADFMAYEQSVATYEAKKLGFDVDEYPAVYTLKEGELWYAINKSVEDKDIVTYQKALNAVKKKPSVRKSLWKKFRFKPY